MKISLKKTSPTLKLLSTTTSTTEVCLAELTWCKFPNRKKIHPKALLVPWESWQVLSPKWLLSHRFGLQRWNSADPNWTWWTTTVIDETKPFRKEVMSLIFWWCISIQIYIYIYMGTKLKPKKQNHGESHVFFFEFALLPLSGVK